MNTLVNRKELAGYFINQAIEHLVFNADNIRFEKIVVYLRAAATAAGTNSFMYTEIINVINDLKNLAVKLELKAYTVWFMISQISVKMRSTNQVLREFMINLKILKILNYLVVPEEKENSTLHLIQGERVLAFERIQTEKEAKFKTTQIFKDRQRSFINLASQEKTIHVFEINLNGK